MRKQRINNENMSRKVINVSPNTAELKKTDVAKWTETQNLNKEKNDLSAFLVCVSA